MIFTLNFFIFLFGSAIGSFLNVVICRLATGEGIPRERFSVKLRRLVGNRSHCPHCGQVLAWYDLLPILSFFLLRARCRYCQKKISWQYPLVEAATGLLFLATFWYLGFENWNLFRISDFGFRIFTLSYLLFIVCALIVIFVYDLRHYIIPDKILFPAIGVSLLYRLFENCLSAVALAKAENFGHWDLFGIWDLGFGIWQPLFSFIAAAVGSSAFFWALILITRGKGMGVGDAKLAILLGLMLGWPDIIIALFLAFWAGALVGVSLIITGKKTLKSQIPFGPFLIAGALAALFWGQGIVDWYWDLLQL